jgi:hypothetical protein
MIDQTISAAVQHSLNNLKSDCEKVISAIAAKEAADAIANASNSSRRAVKVVLFGVCFLFSLVVPVCIALHKLESVFHILSQLQGDDPASWGATFADPLLSLATLSPLWFSDESGKSSTTEELKGLGFAVAVFICYYLISTVVFTYLYPSKEVLSKQKLRHFKLYKQRTEALLTKRKTWYKEYQQIAINKD